MNRKTSHTHANIIEQFVLASPLLCLILVGIAAPLACSGVRVNPMVGTGKALGWFAFNFATVALFSTLGETRVLAPWLAAWLPLALLSAVAFGLWRSAR